MRDQLAVDRGRAPRAAELHLTKNDQEGAYRLVLFLPYAVPGFISILVFKGLFNQNLGEVNLILGNLFGIKPAWFSDPLLAKLMLVFVNVSPRSSLARMSWSSA